MDAKYVATFLLVAVMITRIQCGSGDVCPALKKCMIDSEIMFQNVSNPVDAAKNFFDTVCSNISALVDCYTSNNLKNCAGLKSILRPQSNAENMTDEVTKICAQKKDVIEVYECVVNDVVSESIERCPTMVDTQSNNQANQTTKLCSRLSKISKCIGMTCQCSANAVSFLGSISQKQLGIVCLAPKMIVCSAPKMVVNGLLLCMLYLLNRFLLF